MKMETETNEALEESFDWLLVECKCCEDGCERHGVFGDDGKVSDEYILQRQSANRPDSTLKKIPLLCNLTTSSSIADVDGRVFSMLMVAGFTRMSSKIDELNAINVFPIADGDTGANMRVCLKLPVRNLLLDPSENVSIAVSNLAADVLLNGQGNSGTILSHFFVSLAEEVWSLGKAGSLTLDEFSFCLAGAGAKMDVAVSNPAEGTLLSVCRDTCRELDERGPHPSLEALLANWNEIVRRELAMTPDRLVVDGVKVLERAGVVDSGEQGFAYLVKGMFRASTGELRADAMDAAMFSSTKLAPADDDGATSMSVNHTVMDSYFLFCTKAAVLLKEGIDAQIVVNDIERAVENDGIRDSIATVKAQAREGGDMVKIHMHTNKPTLFFERLRPYSRDPIFKKEKVEDMLLMRNLMHGRGFSDLGEAKFTIMGLCPHVLPAGMDISGKLHTLPLFLVDERTQEQIDARFVNKADACITLNHQRHRETATRYTSAAPNPTQIKIKLLAALGKGKPLLVILMSTDRRISALRRNTMAAIDMLQLERRALVEVFVHGWLIYEAPFVMEAAKCAREGKTINEARAACERLGDRHFSFNNFAMSDTVSKLLALRPGLFPKGFAVEEESFVAFGMPVTVRDECLTEFQRVGNLMNVQSRAKSMSELQDAEIVCIRGNHNNSSVK